MNKIDKKVIWITGAGKGIGAATTMKLADLGAIVAASSKNNFDYHLERKHYSKIYQGKSNLNFYECDVTDKNQILDVYNNIIEQFGKIDILINNAGIGLFKQFSDTDSDEFDSIMNVNFKGAFLCTNTVINDMIKNKSGIIINISSTSVLENFVGCSIYNASKAALIAMSRSLRNEVRQYGIKIIDIIAGPTYTDIWDSKLKSKYKKQMMMPTDVAEIIMQSLISSLENKLMVEEIVIRPQTGNI